MSNTGSNDAKEFISRLLAAIASSSGIINGIKQLHEGKFIKLDQAEIDVINEWLVEYNSIVSYAEAIEQKQRTIH